MTTVDGPLRPTSEALGTGRPAWFDITGGTWGDWRRDNSTTTLRHGIGWLTDLGYLENLRSAIAGRPEPYYGVHWMDSDLYKVIEAIGWDLGHTPDPDHTAFLDEVTDLVVRMQDPDGYVNSHFQARSRDRQWRDLAFGHEMYTGGHLIQAAIAVHRGTGDDRLLGAASRFADHLWRRFGPDGEPRVEGHPEIEMALVELYRETGEARHLELARLFVDRRGHSTLGPGHFGLHYVSDDVPIREATGLTGHAVRAVYFACGATDVAVETGDAALLERLELLWDDLVATRTHLTGGLGSRHFHEAIGERYELPPDRAYAESCASIGLMMWAHRMGLATGRATYAGVAERVLYNAFAASTALDRCHFWYQNPLLKREPGPVPAEDRPVEERVELGTRAPWYDTACCPPNVMRTIAALGWTVATVDVSGSGQRTTGDVVVDQWMPGRLAVETLAGPVALTVSTDYPDDGRIRIAVERWPGGTLRLRIPTWSDPMRTGLTVDGDPRRPAPGADGRVAVTGIRPGSRVELGLDLTVRLTRPHRRIEALTGQVAVERGPVVHALEGVDLPAGVSLIDVGLADEPTVAVARVADRLNGITEITVDGVVRRGARPAWPYGNGPDEPTAAEPIRLRLIPYARWGNRGPTTMRVWLPQQPEETR